MNRSDRRNDEVFERIAMLVDGLPHLVGVADRNGRVQWMNQAGCEFVRADPDVPLSTLDLFTREAFDRYREEIRPEILAGRTWRGELPVRRRDLPLATVEAVVAGGVGADGEVDWVAILAIDVTEQRAREADLTHRASHDALTGLPNRSLALDRLQVASAVADRTGALVAVIVIDLDGFKEINDRHGHATGDLILQQVTARLEAAVRPADTVARFGGDEFVVVVHPPDNARAALLVAQRIRNQIASPAYATELGNVDLSASIGLAVASPGDPDGELLVEAADRGMYRAKRAGGNCVRVSATTGFSESDHLDRIGAQLADAIGTGQITAAFDPVVEIATGRVLQLEVLARWDHPGRGLLRAAEFRDDAEATGFLEDIWWAAADWAIRQAERTAVPIPLEIVLSTDQLARADVVRRVETLCGHDLAAPLRITIDEHSLGELPGAGISTIAELREVGVELVLSGHGLGQMPTAFLADLPLVAIKVSPSIVQVARAEPAAVARAARLGADRQVPSIATMVERPADRDILGVLGVDAVQGIVTGGEWDASRLAAEAVTPPRP